MNSQVVRCKDIRPSFPHVFERLRQGRAQTANSNFAVENWLDRLNGPAPDPLLSHLSPHPSFSCPPGRCPLRQQPTRLAKGWKKQPSMVNPKVGDPVKRFQRTRGGNRNGKGKQNAAEQCQTDGIAETGQKGLEDPFVETNTPPILPSTSPSRRSPTRTISSKGTGKAASSITKREHLANLTPAVKVYSDVREAMAKTAMPKIVKELWKNTLFPALYEEAFIPVGLENRLSRSIDTPMKSQRPIAASHYNSAIEFDQEDLDLIWTTIVDVAKMARQYRSRAPESHWVSAVVAPLLHLIRKLHRYEVDHPEEGVIPQLETLDITTTEISPTSLCPYLQDPDLVKELDKRIDYALGLHLPADKYVHLERGNFAIGCGINQTSSFVNFTPMFTNIEVKKRYTEKDPLIQLTAWIAAEYNKRRLEGYSTDMPVFAIGIEEDGWFLYIAFWTEASKAVVDLPDYSTRDNSRLNFIGPFPMGDTFSQGGILRIIRVLCSLADWGIETYRAWFLEDVLSRYRT